MFLKALGFKPADRNRENYVYGDGQVNSTGQDMAKSGINRSTQKGLLKHQLSKRRLLLDN